MFIALIKLYFNASRSLDQQQNTVQLSPDVSYAYLTYLTNIRITVFIDNFLESKRYPSKVNKKNCYVNYANKCSNIARNMIKIKIIKFYLFYRLMLKFCEINFDKKYS